MVTFELTVGAWKGVPRAAALSGGRRSIGTVGVVIGALGGGTAAAPAGKAAAAPEMAAAAALAPVLT
ncbi:hypothetical protein FLK63_08400, partial [Burkholderia gladioli]|nr:hypothetical protein [Burkholderia gladioli]